MSSYADDHNTDQSQEDSSSNSNNAQGQPQRSSLQSAIEGFLGNNNASERRAFAQVYHELMNVSNSDDNESMSASSAANLQLLQSMIRDGTTGSLFDPQRMGMIIADEGGNGGSKGIDDEFLDTLERVPIRKIPKDKCCSICTSDFHSEEYPLVVELPCNEKHYFDLDCIAPWLKLNRTCPLCRVDVTVGKKKEAPIDSEEEEEDWDMYG